MKKMHKILTAILSIACTLALSACSFTLLPETGNDSIPKLENNGNTPTPETPQPETPQPETPQPETPEPETPQPETPQPETPQPETPEGDSSTPEPPHVHSYELEIVNSAYEVTPKTCTSYAVYYKSCVCGEAGEETFTGTELLPHTEEIDEAVEATCTRDGLTEGKHCFVCKTVLTAQETVPAHHSFNEEGNCSACGQPKVSAGLQFTKNGDGYTVSQGTCQNDVIAIPDTYENLPVTAIAIDAFRGNTSLQKIYIPKSIQMIGHNAFGGCSKLSEFVVDERNTRYMSADGILYSKNQTQLVKYPENKTATSFTVPNTVTVISNYAFSGATALKSVRLHGEITSLGEGVFSSCTGLSSIIIPKSVLFLGGYAFANCNLTVYFEAERQPSGYSNDWHKQATVSDCWYREENPNDTYGNYWHYVGGQATKWN